MVINKNFMTIFYIAEIGINHNGNLKIAKKLIDEAKIAGFNSVKFQKRDINTVYTQDYLNSSRQSPWGLTQREQKEGLEFGKKEYTEIYRYCKKLKINWFASAWDLKSQKFLKKFDCKYNKIASAMIIFKPLLETIAAEKKKTFISTGMSDKKNIEDAVNIFKKNNCPYELMHCVSTYPMANEDANLMRIQSLKKNFNCDVGYSGHEVGLTISYAASAMGITSLERHITLDRVMYGSDQAASVEPQGFVKLVNGVRAVSEAIGSGDIRFNPKELDIAKKLRAHLK